MSEKPTPQGSGAQAEHDLIEALQSGRLTYEQAKNRYRELGAAIQRRYEREITAVSVDVVKSRQAKSNATDLDAQLTFDAYHRWVNSELSNHAHRTGSWSGDGLLALFENPQAAIWFAQSLLDGLTNFNDRFNRLKAPLQIRIGVHTGEVIVGNFGGTTIFDYRALTDPGEGQRFSTYWDVEPLQRGPQPPPPWLVTDRAAMDTELGILKTGKEADVFVVERAVEAAGPSTLMAAKRYRSEEHRSFHRSSTYTRAGAPATPATPGRWPSAPRTVAPSQPGSGRGPSGRR